MVVVGVLALWPISKNIVVSVALCIGLKPLVAFAAFEVEHWGAHSAAMGGAFSAHVGTVEGSWFNPAVAAAMQVKMFTSTHVQLFKGVPGGLKQNSGGGVVPTKYGGATLSFARFGEREYSEQIFAMGFARKMHQRFSLGFQLGNAGWEFGDWGARDWSLSLGGLYEVGWITPHTFARIGLVARGLGSTTRDSGRLTGHRPSRYVFAFELRPEKQIFAAEVETGRGEWELRAGCETPLVGDWNLRFGGNVLFAETLNRTANVGLGYTWNLIRFDYAYSHSYDLSSFGATHRIGIGLFGS
ncbi:MAG: hypothetical protein VX294_09770 [Candidatus Latescibacterota bacterium]|nr:hypothetical protein [Candidatus Latescibacterota bacterium]